VVIGVDDNGQPCGVEIGPETVQRYINEIKVATYPEITIAVEEMGDFFKAELRLVTPQFPPQANEGVNEGVNRLLKSIGDRPGLRMPELSKLLAVPSKTVERWLKQLKEQNKIIFKGASKTGGYYASTDGTGESE
jgi:ATP-dependent DNA helicase RecG